MPAKSAVAVPIENVDLDGQWIIVNRAASESGGRRDIRADLKARAFVAASPGNLHAEPADAHQLFQRYFRLSGEFDSFRDTGLFPARGSRAAAGPPPRHRGMPTVCTALLLATRNVLR